MLVLNERITPSHKNKKHKKKAPLPSSVPVYATEFMLLLLHATHKHHSSRGASILASLFQSQHISNIEAPLDRYFRCVGAIAAVATCVYLWEFRPVACFSLAVGFAVHLSASLVQGVSWVESVSSSGARSVWKSLKSWAFAKRAEKSKSCATLLLGCKTGFFFYKWAWRFAVK